jgi:UDP-N-acetylglucosamine--N-acetylmuramyl-(pentapeptide) pyrophosphoryl-undecaprenol N-acetylglucosamine transferase
MGGFVSGPGGLAAWLCRRPLVIHEQNARPGLTNRLLRRVATRVLSAYPETFAPDSGAQVTGNPVRAEIVAVPPPAQRPVAPSKLRVLILGGSQGARVLNRTVPASVAGLGDTRTALSIRHQCGERDLASTLDAYSALGTDVRVEAFIDDMAVAYADADLVICRAGALTVAEISAVGIASILVPFPHAVDDHQTANARYLASRGAALLVPETEFTPARITEALRSFVQDRPSLVRMAHSARACAFPVATETVAGVCLELLHAAA